MELILIAIAIIWGIVKLMFWGLGSLIASSILIILGSVVVMLLVMAITNAVLNKFYER